LYFFLKITIFLHVHLNLLGYPADSNIKPNQTQFQYQIINLYRYHAKQ